MARAIITDDLIIQMNELYLTIGTYAGVSRAMNGSPVPSTVKKYIIPGYVGKNNLEKKVFHMSALPEFTEEVYGIFDGVDNWGDLCLLSKEETEEVTELWKEILF